MAADQTTTGNDLDYVSALLEVIQADFFEKPVPADLIARFPAMRGEDVTVTGKDVTNKLLHAYPELQQAFAFICHYPPSKWLLEQEAQAIQRLRDFHQPAQHAAPYKRIKPDPQKQHHERYDVYDWARESRLKGICFSGGGIRSATFNLGILQGMASRGSLPGFDYLSSVSGGGYIHAWLAAWLKRKSLERRDTDKRKTATEDDARTALKEVIYRLSPLPERKAGQKHQTVWPRQIQWLRRYSNYLTPRVGLLTSDTWAAIAIWSRNVSLNQTLLISIFLAILSVPHLLAPAVRLIPAGPVAAQSKSSAIEWRTCGWLCPPSPSIPAPTGKDQPAYSFQDQFNNYWHADRNFTGTEGFLLKAWRSGSQFSLAVCCFIGGTVLISLLLRGEYQLAQSPDAAAKSIVRRMPWLRDHQVFAACFMLVLLMTFAVLMTVAISKHRQNADFPAAMFLLLLALVWTETFSGGALGQMMTVRAQKRIILGNLEDDWRRLAQVRNQVWLAGLCVPAAAAGTVGFVAIAALLQSWVPLWLAQRIGLNSACSVQIFLGTLLFFWLVPVTMIMVSGLVGKAFPDWLGEWLGRIRGYSLLMGIDWILLCGPTLLMPGILLAIHQGSHGLIKWPALVTWVGTTAASVIGGRSAKSSGKDDPATSLTDTVISLLIAAGPYVYMGGLVMILSLLLELVHAPLADGLFRGSDITFWCAAIGACLSLAVLLGFGLDINEFSMHSLYRNRLTRCYLGASNATRSPSPVTGFDQRDTADLQIAHMRLEDGYPGPIPIFCCAMNITLGEELAWQERKAASFAFTPYYSGYDVGWTGKDDKISFNGFVPTKFLFDGDPNEAKDVSGPNMATAMAASGAAVSPNMGYHTNPATAFLMTMFDVRLGLWVPNPRRSKLAGATLDSKPTAVYAASPRFAPWWITGELRGCVTDSSKYVYISDGGHFDNMGLYELVRRRCYDIVICDAEEDGDYSYEGIGNAIRRCRIDFGAEINLDLSALTPNTHSRLSPAHVIRGTIQYPETPEKCGEVVYIKASLTGKAQTGPNDVATARGSVELPNVPGDVQSYKLQHAHFPHDSTAEQWFTESQFESYRRLGQAIVDSLATLFTDDAAADPITVQKLTPPIDVKTSDSSSVVAVE